MEETTMIFNGKRILITGGTGSLGKTLVRRLLSGKDGKPKKIIIFSRDETKQHQMRVEYKNKKFVTDEVIYHNFEELLGFWIGDVKDYHSVLSVLRDVDIVFNAAALKQVPTCEYFPFEAVMVNIVGAQNIVRAIKENNLPVETVVGISTDKACKPVNVMGMTKAIQERIFINANLQSSGTRFICVRYGNVLASRGSVIPLFHEQILSGNDVTITTPDMTRFLLALDYAVDLIFAAVENAIPGETFIPRVPSARVYDIAKVLIGKRKNKIKVIGIRPGEKIHEILVSEEESHRTIKRDDYYVILPILPEIKRNVNDNVQYLNKEYSSSDDIMSIEETLKLLRKHKLLLENKLLTKEEELLR
jgi:UDP-glucose 4-epimerase